MIFLEVGRFIEVIQTVPGRGNVYHILHDPTDHAEPQPGFATVTERAQYRSMRAVAVYLDDDDVVVIEQPDPCSSMGESVRVELAREQVLTIIRWLQGVEPEMAR